MGIGKDTQVCISIAERPGNFGSSIFNSAFEALGLNFIYKPFRVSEDDLESAVKGIRAFNIRGCGVSMPHKIKVMKYLDCIDPAAREVGAVNTIVNNQGVLSGYNTDLAGAKRALAEVYDVRGKKALIIGSGGVSRAIIMALKSNGAARILITNRDEKKGRQVAKEFDLEYYPYSAKNDPVADLLINATPVGMNPHLDDMIIPEKSLAGYEAVMDVVIYPPETLLVTKAGELNKAVIPGQTMALYQAAEQFRLYTGQQAPLEVMRNIIKKAA